MSYKYSHIGKNFAKNYDTNIWNNFESRISNVENEILMSYLKRYITEKNAAILDFACGTWRITSFIASQYENITGYDVSEDMLAIARWKNPGIKFLKKDILVENVDMKFDLITSFRFFLNEEYPLKVSVLLALKEYLLPDGVLIFNIHMNSWSLAFFLTRCKHLLGLNPIRQNGMSYFDTKAMLRKCGYLLIESRWYSFLLWNPLLKFLPFSFLRSIDLFLSKIPFLKFFSKDIIYVCKKLNDAT